MAKKKVLVLTTGEKVPVIEEQGKYWVCDGRQFRKLSKMIRSVEEVDSKPESPADEPKKENVSSEKPKKKKASKPSPAKQEKNEEA